MLGVCGSGHYGFKAKAVRSSEQGALISDFQGQPEPELWQELSWRPFPHEPTALAVRWWQAAGAGFLRGHRSSRNNSCLLGSEGRGLSSASIAQTCEPVTRMLEELLRLALQPFGPSSAWKALAMVESWQADVAMLLRRMPNLEFSLRRDLLQLGGTVKFGVSSWFASNIRYRSDRRLQILQDCRNLLSWGTGVEIQGWTINASASFIHSPNLLNPQA